MIRSSKGFTLIEVLIALAVFALVMTPILVTQTSIVERIARSSHQLARYIAAESLLMENAVLRKHDQKVIAQQNVQASPALLRYQTKEPSESLKKYKGIVTEQVIIEWTDNKRKRTDTLVCLAFKPEEKK